MGTLRFQPACRDTHQAFDISQISWARLAPNPGRGVPSRTAAQRSRSDGAARSRLLLPDGPLTDVQFYSVLGRPGG